MVYVMSKVLTWIFATFLFFLPLLFPDYWILILVEILIMGFFAMSFNLLFGYSGLLSFGHAGLFGVGAFVTALLIEQGYTSLWLLITAGTIGAGIVSLIIGFLCVQHDEIYFAMITLAFGMMLFTVAHNWTSLTGGSDGLPLMKIPSLHLLGNEYSLFLPEVLYYSVLVFTSIAALFLWRLINSPFGLLLKGLRENKNRLRFAGGNIKLIRLVAFIISGAFSGLAGVLFCWFSSMATPDFLHWSFSAKPVIMSILGGAGVFLGPLFGAAIFFILEQAIWQFTDNWMIFLGMVLIPIVLFFPQGVVGSLQEVLKRGNK